MSPEPRLKLSNCKCFKFNGLVPQNLILTAEKCMPSVWVELALYTTKPLGNKPFTEDFWSNNQKLIFLKI